MALRTEVDSLLAPVPLIAGPKCFQCPALAVVFYFVAHGYIELFPFGYIDHVFRPPVVVIVIRLSEVAV